MHVHDDTQSILQHRIHSRVELGDKGGIQAVRRSAAQQLIAIDAEPHMVEAHRMHQGDVIGGGVAAQPVGRIVARLGKPHAGVDAAMQQLGSSSGHARSGQTGYARWQRNSRSARSGRIGRLRLRSRNHEAGAEKQAGEKHSHGAPFVQQWAAADSVRWKWN